MKNLIRQIALVLCVALLSISILVNIRARRSADSDYYENAPLSDLTVTAVDVGKGDAILLTCEGESLLIDTGYDNTWNTLEQALKDAGITRLDALVLTHFDKDHVGGADRLLKAFSVDRILVPDYTSDSKQYKEYISAAQKAGITPEIVPDTLEFTLGDASCTIYPPLLSSYEQPNDYSLALSVTHGLDSFLFTGDAESLRLQELMGQMPLEHSYLKVPHHGALEDNSSAFLRTVAPCYAVITCDKEDPADPELLSILEDMDTQVYFTSDGSVTCISQGTGELDFHVAQP